MVSTTVLTLLVIPVIYALWRGKHINRARFSWTLRTRYATSLPP